jgi:hypothetical protein
MGVFAAQQSAEKATKPFIVAGQEAWGMWWRDFDGTASTASEDLIRRKC